MGTVTGFWADAMRHVLADADGPQPRRE